MAKKILVFLSQYREPPDMQLYSAPDGTTVGGALTNDAPLRYLLHKHPDTEELLCITTAKSAATFQRLESLLREDGCSAECRKIAYDEAQSFEATVLPVVSASLQPGDQLLLDITGGLRDIILYLTLLCRIFTYRGIRITEAVYSNLNPPRIADATSLLQMFDLVGGMQELTSFGSVRTLRAYYARQKPDEAVEELLSSVEQLKECIDLCRTQKLMDGMERFRLALQNAAESNDPMLHVLLPVFRSKFGDKVDILQLIRWCIDSEMLQQALTIYNELIPELIYGDNGLVYATWAIPALTKNYATYETGQLVDGVLKMSQRHLAQQKERGRTAFDSQGLLDALRTEDDRRDLLYLLDTGMGETALPDYVRENLAAVCALAYDRSGEGPYDPDWVEQLPKNRRYLSTMQEWMESEQLETAESFLASLYRCPEKKRAKLLERPEWDFIPYHGKKMGFVKTIDQLGELMPLFGYDASIPVKRLQHILADYLYIRTLRNMANHANDSSTADQKQILEDLVEYQYPDPEEVGSAEAGRLLIQAVERLEQELYQ